MCGCTLPLTVTHIFKEIDSAGAVAHACNPSDLGSGDWEDHSSRPTWAKILKTLSQPIKLGMEHASVIPATWEV
jgi:hypothetical protein